MKKFDSSPESGANTFQQICYSGIILFLIDMFYATNCFAISWVRSLRFIFLIDSDTARLSDNKI